jgi:hypothetical protein
MVHYSPQAIVLGNRKTAKNTARKQQDFIINNQFLSLGARPLKKKTKFVNR